MGKLEEWEARVLCVGKRMVWEKMIKGTKAEWAFTPDTYEDDGVGVFIKKKWSDEDIDIQLTNQGIKVTFNNGVLNIFPK